MRFSNIQRSTSSMDLPCTYRSWARSKSRDCGPEMDMVSTMVKRRWGYFSSRMFLASSIFKKVLDMAEENATKSRSCSFRMGSK